MKTMRLPSNESCKVNRVACRSEGGAVPGYVVPRLEPRNGSPRGVAGSECEFTVTDVSRTIKVIKVGGSDDGMFRIWLPDTTVTTKSS